MSYGDRWSFSIFRFLSLQLQRGYCYKWGNNNDSPAKHSFRTSWFLSASITVSKYMVQVWVPAVTFSFELPANVWIHQIFSTKKQSHTKIKRCKFYAFSSCSSIIDQESLREKVQETPTPGAVVNLKIQSFLSNSQKQTFN